MSIYKGGNAEGSRVAELLKERERNRQYVNKQKMEISKENDRRAKITDKFSSTQLERDKVTTYGLVTLDEMKARQKALEEENEERLKGKRKSENKDVKKKKKKKKREVLTFDMDEEEEEVKIKKAPTLLKPIKNPEVDTSFLPDRERDRQQEEEKERLRQEWLEQQAKIKSEIIEITYSYWDGSGHRRKIKMKKGDTIEAFLQACLADLRSEFPELRGVSAEGLIYVKEDLLIPSHYSFYDFIVTKARGKSGPLFSFDVHDDVRLVNDATIEKDESHAGKVLLRSWYDRNKHIFPANRWEAYDPEKKYESYSIADSKKK
eukprot:m.20599 g.20599  ORF g.20599 m.20599 type:complete len:319 (+) comp6894_c0_seq1:198-1154(+)